ncbi:hypothetical protein SteCoe_11207 [Stentor coeruleus]|uniref:RRM domain-containing protein n=1 Tax=Stentor coeruleus TaxID=5963 RepID=A0A1R2CDQ5_9CILI|nr:hypothetical protein SteCoe_11207 [Stentor coeruleus]
MQGFVEALAIHAGGEIHAYAANRKSHIDYISQVITDLRTPASLEVAKNHRDMNSLRNWVDNKAHEFSFWCSSTVKFASYSLGFVLHFMLVKQLIFIFFVVAGTSILQLYLNYKGNYFPDSKVGNVFDKFSIGNCYGENNLSSDSESDNERVDKEYFWIWVSDCCCSGFILLMILGYFIYAYISIGQELKNTHKISDFTLEVKGLPRTDVKVEEIKEHFSQFGHIVEVFIGRRYGDCLYLYTEKAKISEEIKMRESYLHFRQIEQSTDKKLKKLNSKRYKLELKIREGKAVKKHEDLEIKRAYIVFDRQDDKIRCLKIYNRTNCCGCKVQKKKYKFRGKNKLELFPSTEPSDIIWENLEIGKCSRFFRFLCSLILTIIFLAMSIAMIYYVKTAQSKLPTDKECEAYKDINIPGESKDDNQTLCYCENLSSSDLIEKDNAETCYVYIEYVTHAWGMKFLSSFGIILVNFFLKVVMRKLSSFERPKTKSEIQTKIFKKVLLVMFINTAILIFLVNLTIPALSDYVLQGKYTDFTREWFLAVGSLIFSLMLISLVSPHLIFLFIAYPLSACKRKCCWRTKKSQYELNMLYTGPEFDIATRTAQIFNVIFTSYLYSGGIPLLNCTCFIFLIIIYYTDKFLVLKHNRSPPYYNEDLYISAMKIFPIAVMLHCAVSLYIYGSPSIFPVFYDENSTVHTIFGDTLGKRIERPSGYVNCFLIIGGICLIGLLNFLDLICGCCIKKIRESTRKQGTFTELKDDISKTGLCTYDIRSNPDYAMIINEMDESVMLDSMHNKQDYFDTLRSRGPTSRNETLLAHLSIDKGNEADESVEPKCLHNDESYSDSSNPDFSRDEKYQIDVTNYSKKNTLALAEPEEVSLRDEDIEQINSESIEI